METKKQNNEEIASWLPMLLLGVLAVAIAGVVLKLIGVF